MLTSKNDSQHFFHNHSITIDFNPSNNTIFPPISYEDLIQSLLSLSEPTPYIKTTLRKLDYAFETHYSIIPFDSLPPLVNLFISLDGFEFQFGDDEIEENDDEEFNKTSLDYILSIMYNLMKIQNEDQEYIYLPFFISIPQVIEKLLSVYHFSPKARDILVFFVKFSPDFLPDFIQPIINLIQTEPFNDGIANLMYQIIVKNQQIIPLEEFLGKIDESLRSQNDTNLYSTSLSILTELIKEMPKELVQSQIESLQFYIHPDGDVVDHTNQIELYIQILESLETFDGIVSETFLRLIIEIIQTDLSLAKYIQKIFLYNFDFTPFLAFPDFLVSLMDFLENSSFTIQKSIVIFYSKIMKIASAEMIVEFSKSKLFTMLPILLQLDANDLDLVGHLLMIVHAFISVNCPISIELLEAITEIESFENEQISQAAKSIEMKISEMIDS